MSERGFLSYVHLLSQTTDTELLVGMYTRRVSHPSREFGLKKLKKTTLSEDPFEHFANISPVVFQG